MKKGKTGVGTPIETNVVSNTVDAIAYKAFDNVGVIPEARRILKTGNPIEYILDTFNTIHVEDRQTGEILALSVGSACIENCAGLHPKLSGESGKGKSHSCKT